MAHISIPDEGRQISDLREIATFLSPFGIHYERWDTGAPRVSADASTEEILAAYAPEVDELKRRGGYVTADVINVTPDLPGLDAMLDRFNKEHTHSEDEVRFIVKGRGVFHIRLPEGPVIALQLDAGDLINVPASTRHWFDLCADRTIRAIRLFLDPSGWSPQYEEGCLHTKYSPMCWGPNDVPTAAPRLKSVVIP